MAFLWNEKVLYHLPFTSGLHDHAHTDKLWGSNDLYTLSSSGIIGSGLNRSSTGLGPKLHCARGTTYPASPNTVSLTAAMWVSGAYPAFEFQFGYGAVNSLACQNGMSLYVNSDGKAILGSYVQGNWVGLSPRNPVCSGSAWTFLVFRVQWDGVRASGDTSVNGGNWVYSGKADMTVYPSGTDAEVGFYYFPAGSYSQAGGWPGSPVDEVTLWRNADKFTAGELQNLYSLSWTHGRPMDEYSEQYSPPPSVVSGVCPVFMGGAASTSGSVTLDIGGLGAASGSCPLLVGGQGAIDESCSLSLVGCATVSGAVPLDIGGLDRCDGSCDAVLGGVGFASGFCSTRLLGAGLVSGVIALWAVGCPSAGGLSGVCQVAIGGKDVASGSLDCHAVGFEPLEPGTCPILDPNASIQISSELIHVYQASIDALINQLGDNLILEYDPERSACPNCQANVYRPGGPVAFPLGRKCPYCKGAGAIETPVTRCIKCLVKWRAGDYRRYGVVASDPKAVIRTKGYLADAPAIAKARTALLESKGNLLRLRVKRLRGPIPVGLREDRYCVTFWELVDG